MPVTYHHAHVTNTCTRIDYMYNTCTSNGHVCLARHISVKTMLLLHISLVLPLHFPQDYTVERLLCF